MSPRIKTLRKISNPPKIKGFRPYGSESNLLVVEPVNLLFEEYEALRLSDYDNCNHHQASVMMGVSRPTFTRIYASSLRKIAKAFVEGRQISIEGGKVYFDSDWYQCSACFCYFNNPEKDKKTVCCPLCGNPKILPFDNIIANDEIMKPVDFCVCIDCGYEQLHFSGSPCSQQICPQCNKVMRRKNVSGCESVKKK
jgi:predicted DNA-binding protein (UPF0251 family)